MSNRFCQNPHREKSVSTKPKSEKAGFAQPCNPSHLAEDAQRIVMLKKKVPDPKKGISPSALHQMEEKLNLMKA